MHLQVNDQIVDSRADNVFIIHNDHTSSNQHNNALHHSLLAMGSALATYYLDRPIVLINEASTQSTSDLDFRSPSGGGETGLDFIRTVQNAKERIRNLEAHLPIEYQHLDHSIEGILWLQERPEAPETSLTVRDVELRHLINDFRQEFSDANLPFLIRGEDEAGAVSVPDMGLSDDSRSKALYCNRDFKDSSCSVDAIAQELFKISHGGRSMRGRGSGSQRWTVPTSLLCSAVFGIAAITLLLILDTEESSDKDDLSRRNGGNIPLLFFASEDEEWSENDVECLSQGDYSDCLDMLEAQKIHQFINDVPAPI